MFDLSSKFNTFYNQNVVLPQAKQSELHEKKKINIQRLKDGLNEYNKENKTSYVIIEDCVQGSVAMSTVVQNESSNYDIDVAIVFEKNNLGNLGPLATRNMVANALERKAKQFKTPPSVKTSCVRVEYEDGYHIDFAVFRKYYDALNKRWIYEHAGADWTQRDLKGLTQWFDSKNQKTNGKLRQVIRLSKMFCNSRSNWRMPSGLLQSVLCDESLQTGYERIDESFYYTMKEIVSRLEKSTAVQAPVDNGRDLTPRQKDIDRMNIWKNRLKSKLDDLDILFEDNCTEADALQAWYGFFNHDYCEIADVESYERTQNQIQHFDDKEEFIEDMHKVNIQYQCEIVCTISGDGYRSHHLSTFLRVLSQWLPHDLAIHCSMTTNCPEPYNVLWKVKNVGTIAQRRNQLRGQIIERGKSITELSNFYGNHYIECYIVKNKVCVAREKIRIPIGK